MAGLVLAVIECKILGGGIVRIPAKVYSAVSWVLEKFQMDCFSSFNGDPIKPDEIYKYIENVQNSGSRPTSVGNDSFQGGKGYSLSGSDS